MNLHDAIQAVRVCRIAIKAGEKLRAFGHYLCAMNALRYSHASPGSHTRVHRAIVALRAGVMVHPL